MNSAILINRVICITFDLLLWLLYEPLNTSSPVFYFRFINTDAHSTFALQAFPHAALFICNRHKDWTTPFTNDFSRTKVNLLHVRSLYMMHLTLKKIHNEVRKTNYTYNIHSMHILQHLSHLNYSTCYKTLNTRTHAHTQCKKVNVLCSALLARI